MEKLNTIIETLVAEKSLSLEVFQQLKEIKEQSNLVAEENKSLKESLDRVVKENALIKVELDNFKEKEGALVTRENLVLDTEHKLELKDKEVEKAQAVANTTKEIVGMVFKNVIIRKGINKSTNTPVMVNGYQQNVYTNDTYNEDQTEE